MIRQLTANKLALSRILSAGEDTLINAMAPEACVYAPKAQIVREDEEQNALFRVMSGCAVRRRTIADGRSRIMSVLLPGDMIGVRGLLSHAPADLIESRQAVRLQSVRYSRLLDLAAQDANVAMWLLWYVNQRNVRHDKWSTLLAQGSAVEKVAILLLDLYERLSRFDGVADGPVRIWLTQRDIADHVGLALPHVCRTLAILRDRGGVNIRYGAIEIIDPRALTENAADMAAYWNIELTDEGPGAPVLQLSG